MGRLMSIALLRLAIGLAQRTWNIFWAIVREAMLFAEQQHQEAGGGEVKKEYVMSEVRNWLIARGVTRWRKRIILRVVDDQVDQAVAKLNTTLGDDWGAHVDEARAHLASFIPIIE